MKLTKDFYLRDNVIQIAKELIGKTLITCFDGYISGGIITETEAYNGIIDKASHAYNNRNTKRTEIMYREGGIAYVYLCYGLYSLFNVVTNVAGVPHAILVRGIKPTLGIDIIKERLYRKNLINYPLNGPGKVSKALAIHYTHSGNDLCSNQIWCENNEIKINESEIIETKRIGIDYAEEDAMLPYRFVLKNIPIF